MSQFICKYLVHCVPVFSCVMPEKLMMGLLTFLLSISRNLELTAKRFPVRFCIEASMVCLAQSTVSRIDYYESTTCDRGV